MEVAPDCDEFIACLTAHGVEFVIVGLRPRNHDFAVRANVPNDPNDPNVPNVPNVPNDPNDSNDPNDPNDPNSGDPTTDIRATRDIVRVWKRGVSPWIAVS